MKTIKNKLFLATAILALASCADNTYLGDQEINNTGNGGVISFNMNTPQLTRSSADEVTKLGSNFVIFGYKTMAGSTTQPVFDNYQVNYVTSSANTTTSNTAGWEYVGYKNLPYGTTTTDGGTLNTDGVAKNATGTVNAVDQTIKYWDTNATQYDFFAYSLGVGEPDNNDEGTDPQYAKASKLTNSTYTLEGNATQLGACYISKKKTISSISTSTPQVQLEFVNFLSKIQLKFYETIPGYAVKDLKFYYDDSNKTQGTSADDGLKPALYGGSSSIMGGGQYRITFDSNGNPVVTLTSNTNYTHASKVEFNAISSGVWLDHYATTLDYKEAANVGGFLARESSAATSTSQITVLPNSTGTALTLKIDYTLVSRDGTGETIQITGKTAKIPAQYTQWKSNFAYTYLFKITDEELTPITLDAVIVDTDQGTQETITTVSEPSITTFGVKNNAYSAGKNEYETGTDIYATITSNGTIADPTSKYIVYTATTSDVTKLITEASVADAIAEKAIKGVTPVITCTGYTTNVSVETSVPAEDGSTKTVTGAIKMQSPAAATYVVAYKQTAGSATATTADYDESATYYKMETTAEGFYPLATASELTTDKTDWATNKSKYTTAPTQPVYIYKVIKVVAP